jgi:hypothetical protein
VDLFGNSRRAVNCRPTHIAATAKAWLSSIVRVFGPATVVHHVKDTRIFRHLFQAGGPVLDIQQLCHDRTLDKISTSWVYRCCLRAVLTNQFSTCHPVARAPPRWNDMFGAPLIQVVTNFPAACAWQLSWLLKS